MTLRATSAFAPAFTHTAAPTPAVDFDVLPPDTAGVHVSGVVASGTYRMCLAPSGDDFLRAFEAAVNTALSSASSATTVALSLSTAGVVTLTFSTALSAAVTLADSLWRMLGFASGSLTLDAGHAVTGTRPVWYLALLSAVKRGPPQPQQAGGAEETPGGRVYAVAASATSWALRAAVSYQPTYPAQRAASGAEATALEPEMAYLGALGDTTTAREWTVLDVLYVARNAACGVALDSWPAIRTSTTTAFYVADIGPRTLLSPELKAQDETWDAWADWTLDLVLPTSNASTTRA